MAAFRAVENHFPCSSFGLPCSSLLFFCYSSVYQGRTCTIPGLFRGEEPSGHRKSRSAPPRGSSCAPRALPRRSPSAARCALRVSRSSRSRRRLHHSRSRRLLLQRRLGRRARRRRRRLRRCRPHDLALVIAVDLHRPHAPLRHDRPWLLPWHDHGHCAARPRMPLRCRARIRRLVLRRRRKARLSGGSLLALLLVQRRHLAHLTCVRRHDTGRRVSSHPTPREVQHDHSGS